MDSIFILGCPRSGASVVAEMHADCGFLPLREDTVRTLANPEEFLSPMPSVNATRRSSLPSHLRISCCSPANTGWRDSIQESSTRFTTKSASRCERGSRARVA